MDACVAADVSAAPAVNRKSPKQYQLTLMLAVDDATALWNAAAQRCAETPGLTLADIEDMIGPREDPSIEDCLTMIALPAGVAGCHMIDFSLRPLNGSVASLPSRNDRRSS